ncbi:hypothetical protein HF086_016074 [Spodoptera exigua]|uniref:Uncharacterized protein n=1 Tax=Spodoptera exigua TaxID=7107 RepID=A0A922M677_SPOEX|nr:hypothetical protein HF086_016074 [Spodoptera exigua]
MDDAQVKIDNRLKYILGLPPSSDPPIITTEAKVQMFAPKQDFETMLECQKFKSQVSPTRKYVTIPGFILPEFFRHKQCDCYACINPYCPLIFYITAGLEASMYFRANEQEIGKNYFKGVINSFSYFDTKLKAVLSSYTELDFEKYIVDHVKSMFEDQFKKVKLEILIEASFFEMKNGNFDAADDYIVTIHEICQDMRIDDAYLNNEIMNLMVASARLRNVVKKHEFDLESEFENLKLSPKMRTEGDKTPESKPKLPQMSARRVKDEELPKKRKVIKLNLDENSSDEKEEKPKPRKPVSEFKIPVPVTSKPVLEILTPRPSRKPVITVTDTAKTPVNEKTDKSNEFFTPMSTPEQFFTPLNTIKTYSKSTLRKGIVKNLEHEFSTPKAVPQKENSKNLDAPRSSRKEEKDRALKRATSNTKNWHVTLRPLILTSTSADNRSIAHYTFKELRCYGCGKQGVVRSKCDVCAKTISKPNDKTSFNIVDVDFCSEVENNSYASPSDIDSCVNITNISTRDNHPMVNISVAGRGGVAIIDTGATHSIASPLLYRVLVDSGVHFTETKRFVRLAPKLVAES